MDFFLSRYLQELSKIYALKMVAQMLLLHWKFLFTVAAVIIITLPLTYRSGSSLIQVMACRLTAPSHYLKQCWHIISRVLWHAPEGNFFEMLKISLEYVANHTSKNFHHISGENETRIKTFWQPFEQIFLTPLKVFFAVNTFMIKHLRTHQLIHHKPCMNGTGTTKANTMGSVLMNSLAPGKSGYDFKKSIFNLVSLTGICKIFLC